MSTGGGDRTNGRLEGQARRYQWTRGWGRGEQGIWDKGHRKSGTEGLPFCVDPGKAHS